ncbi:hypothetical protein O3777_00335 [Gemella sanguinis]|uniref:hypothetical protein n=1 Tax=Gemella sanguinis TaxID=84135 RepID=UPI00352F09A3
MKDMLSVILRIISGIVAFFMIIIVFAFNYETGEDKGKIRKDQERIVEYIKEKVELNDNEEIKKIEFKGYEENFSTGYWSYDVILNNKITISFLVRGLGGELLIETYKGGKLKFLETNKKYNNGSAEVIYAK